MALRLWASSAANALKISGTGAGGVAPVYSISRYFATGSLSSCSRIQDTIVYAFEERNTIVLFLESF
jgi:hypothetical protein